MRDIGTYWTKELANIKEFEELAKIENIQIKKVNEILNQLILGQFIRDAPLDKIKRYEKMYQIGSTSTEDLQFRKDRIINRMRTVPPFSKKFLCQKLDEIVGVGKWELTIDYENYTFYIESSALNQSWFEEIRVTIDKVKPCNMIFINKPYMVDELKLSETIRYQTIDYNYMLGKWQLGQKKFAEIENKSEIKRGDTVSLSDDLMLKTGNDIMSKIAKIRINDSFDIAEFKIFDTVKQDETYIASIEYKVMQSKELGSEIRNIKMLSNSDEILTQANVYVPAINDLILKHSIKLKEGV